MEMYPASAKLTPLRRYWPDRVGTISTVQAGSLTGWWSFATVDPGVLQSSSTEKILMDGWLVCINGSPIITAFEVHAVL